MMEIESIHKHSRLYFILQTIVIVAIIISATFLTYYDKFNAPMGLLLGTLAGALLTGRIAKKS